MRVDPNTALYSALGADLLRSRLLGAAPPKLGGRYVVEKIVGRGASGVVVSALDDRLGRAVALKLSVTGGDASMLEEARSLALLDHPNVVRVHDVDIVSTVIDGASFRLWLVSMQLVVGRSLRTWLAEQQQPLDEIMRVFLDAGRGLAAAHGEKIIHRDFKPDNVVVREGDGVAMVLDFGFAMPASSTRMGVPAINHDVAGTDAYMAPEARAGRPTRRGDQYSFGVSLVEALTGVASPAGRRPPSVPRAIWSVAARATAQRVDRRYDDMAALLAELHAAPTAPASAWRRLTVVGVALVAAGVLAVGWGGASISAMASRLPGVFRVVTSPQRPAAAQPADADHRHQAGSDAGAVHPDVPATDGDVAAPSTASLGPPPIVPPRDVPQPRSEGNVDAGTVSCLALNRTYYFRTVRTTSDRPGGAPSANYMLALGQQLRQADTSLTKRTPQVDHLHVTTVVPDDDCSVRIRATAEDRTYDFHLWLLGGHVEGTFAATGDRRLGNFSGRVESTAAVSHSAPLAGHGHRSPR